MVQASEKLHKAAEEAMKALAWTQANGVCKEVEEKGRWTSPFRAEDKPRCYNCVLPSNIRHLDKLKLADIIKLT